MIPNFMKEPIALFSKHVLRRAYPCVIIEDLKHVFSVNFLIICSLNIYKLKSMSLSNCTQILKIETLLMNKTLLLKVLVISPKYQ